MAARKRAAAAVGSLAAHKARTTAQPSAPAERTDPMFDSSIAPMATNGLWVTALARFKPPSPHGCAVSVLVGVAKTGLTPR